VRVIFRSCAESRRACVPLFSWQEKLLPARLHHFPDIRLTPAVRTAVDGRRIDVIHAEIKGTRNDRHRKVKVVRSFERGFAAKAENAYLIAGLPRLRVGMEASVLAFAGGRKSSNWRIRERCTACKKPCSSNSAACLPEISTATRAVRLFQGVRPSRLDDSTR
jgi:hypothetical protein